MWRVLGNILCDLVPDPKVKVKGVPSTAALVEI